MNSYKKYMKYIIKNTVLNGGNGIQKKIRSNYLFRNELINKSLSKEEIAFWRIVKYNFLGKEGFDPELCKIISSFKGSNDTDFNKNFIDLEPEKKEAVICLFFEDKSVNIEIFLCPSSVDNLKRQVIFYDSMKMKYLIDAFKLHFYFGLEEKIKNDEIKQYLLSIPCLWIRGRPIEEELIIKILFGNILPCYNPNDPKDRTEEKQYNILISLDDEIWNINEKTRKLKDIYQLFLSYMYSI